MNKADFVSAVAEKRTAIGVAAGLENPGVTKKETSVWVDVMLSTLQDVLATGEPVKLTGFGAFEVPQREARKGRNPQTGEEIEIPASKTVKFKASKALKEAVNA